MVDYIHKLDRAIYDLISRETYYGEILSQIPRQFDDKVNTACVKMSHGEIEMIFAPKFISSLSQDEVYGLLKHECLHLIFKHLDKDILGENFTKGKSKYRNVAEDTVINQYIDKKHLPECGITLEKFKAEVNPNALPFKNTDYYEALLKQAFPDEEKDLSKYVMDNHDAMIVDDEGEGGEDSNGNDVGVSKEVEKVLVQNILNKALKNSKGKIPNELKSIISKRYIDSVLNVGQIDWRKALAIFIGSTKNYKTEDTRSKRNRRLGTLIAGRRSTKKAKIMVGIDVSGSISIPDLKLFYAELQQLNANLEHDYVIVSCDTSIHDVYTNNLGSIKKSKQSGLPVKVKLAKRFNATTIKLGGGGGTLYQPFMDTAKKLECDGLIVFGDMQCSEYELNLNNIRTLFISNGSDPVKCNNGKYSCYMLK